MLVLGSVGSVLSSLIILISRVRIISNTFVHDLNLLRYTIMACLQILRSRNTQIRICRSTYIHLFTSLPIP